MAKLGQISDLKFQKDLGSCRRLAYKNLPKTLNISSATARVASGFLKALAILPDITVRRFAFEREDLKPYWK